MRGSALLAALLVLPLAGCVDVRDAATPVPAAPPGFDMGPRNEVHLAFHGIVNGTYAVGLDFGEKQECEVAYGMAAHVSPGRHALMLAEMPEGNGWFFFHSAATGVHSGGEAPVDTRPLQASSGDGGMLMRVDGPVHGRWNLTWAATFNEKGSLLTPDVPASLDIRCERDFEILWARSGEGMLLSNGDDLSGGAGASAMAVASVVKGDHAERTFTAPDVRVLASAFGYQKATVKLTHPSGEETWEFPREAQGFGRLQAYSLRDGAGTYGITVDRVGAYAMALWIGIWAQDRNIDLAAAEQDGQVYQAP